MCCLTPLSGVVQLEPHIQAVDEPPTVGGKVLLDLLFEDLHGILEELRHRLDHLDQGHLIVAAAVLISFLQASVAVKASLVIVRFIDEDKACRKCSFHYKNAFQGTIKKSKTQVKISAVSSVTSSELI